MNGRLLALLVTLAMTELSAALLYAQTSPADALSAETFKSEEGQTLNYRLLVPPKIEEGKKYPLVVFLHGAGERGSDNAAQMKHGVTDFVRNQSEYPCFLIAPQCPEGKKWVEVNWSAESHDLPKEPGDQMAMVRALIDQMVEEKPIDADRIYITGLSMGGYGTWDAITRYPDLFAAAAPICGGGDPQHAKTIKDIPIWCFHGDQDQAVKVERSRAMIAAIKEAGGEPKYTEYPGVAHDSWTRTYADDDFFAWLFAQKRGE
ncbi:MAG TPA: PHB depolymerase family esterase [Pirellulaceae bacterium]|jgi:predicted peptidase|nr:PHB depolymerase family esterase [Pirellulaceae bacterium]